MLDIRQLHSGYGSVPVLRDINFAVDAGEIVLVVGENGAGKSTLLRTLAGFIKPTQGSVTLQKADVTGQSPEQLVAGGLRLVLDGHRVFPELSTYDNLRLGAVVRGADRGQGKVAFQAAIDEILEVFPILKTKLRNPARDLSGGQQQMLALGQAFVARPTVLLCDEPSTGLATALLPPIMAFLRRWALSGTAILIVEQHVDIALPVADRVIMVERGQLKFECSSVDFQARSISRERARATA